MASNIGFVQLGDFFPDRQLTCGIEGCSNLCIEQTELPQELKAIESIPDIVCDDCRRRLAELEMREMPCQSVGCNGKWLCTPLQLREHELKHGGNGILVKGYCDQCREKLVNLADMRVPCSLTECTNTWIWSAEQQLAAAAAEPPERYCQRCQQDIRRIQNRQIQCRFDACPNAWTWDAVDQLRHIRRGHSLNAPPENPCDECVAAVAALAEIEMPCSVRGCKRTWIFSVEAQHQYRLIHGTDGRPPRKMCRECDAFRQSCEDKLVPCQTRGCHGRCLYSARHQLDDFAAGIAGPPKMFCRKCRARLQKLTDKTVECCIPGCNGVWTYTAFDQFIDETAKRVTRKQDKRCVECDEFLAGTSVEILVCEDCGGSITWSPYEQLMCRKGGFSRPQICSECSRRKLSKATAEETIVHHNEEFRIVIPARGPWLRDKALTDWPPAINHEALVRMQSAHTRVVVLHGHENGGSMAWYRLLDEKLRERSGQRDVVDSVAVVDAGIPGTTSIQALTRFNRDVLPFKPQVVVFSFVLPDGMVSSGRGALAARLALAASEKAVDELCSRIRKADAVPVCLIPHPVFPGWALEAGEEMPAGWESLQDAEFRQRAAALAHVCRNHAASVFDFRSRFEVNGHRSARKWMADWYQPNAAGHENIAVWLADELERGVLNPHLS